MLKKFDAILLAAGNGTRLRPITRSIPKCLVDILGKPLLEYWLDLLRKSDSLSKIFINTHYLAEQVQEFLNERPKSRINIERTFEAQLLGTAGTLLANQNFLWR